MIQKVKVNLIPAYDLTLPVVHFKQYDQTDSGVGKQIQLELYSGDDIYEIPSGSIVTFQGTKLDKTGYQYEVASYDGNIVTVDIKGQMTVLSGSHEAELRIVKGDSIISTTRLVMDIEEAALADDTTISETDLPLLYEAIEAVGQIVELERKIDTKQDKLVSGTNIKTIGGESLLGSGDIAISTDYEDLTSKPSINGTTLTGNRVLVSKINNTSPNSDGSITITTVSKDASDIATNTANIATNTANIATNTANIATNTANIATNTSNISKKQDTLVSGTNIKTVNGNSLLGSGNIEVDITAELYYQPGDTIDYYYGSKSEKGKYGYGFVTSSTTICYVVVPVKKRVPAGITITCSSLKGMIRTTQGGYLDGQSSSDTQWVNDTYTTVVYDDNGDDNVLNIVITKNGAFTNVTNNTPVIMMIRELKVTFS